MFYAAIVDGGARARGGGEERDDGRDGVRALEERSLAEVGARVAGAVRAHERAGAAVERVVTHAYFDRLLLGLIILNTVVLALDRYPADHGLAYVLDVVNFVLTACFTVEVVLKSLGLGVRQYLRDSFNLFDFVVVVVSVIEIIVAPAPFLKGSPFPTADDAAGGAISALRTLRRGGRPRGAPCMPWRARGRRAHGPLRTLRPAARSLSHMPHTKQKMALGESQ